MKKAIYLLLIAFCSFSCTQLKYLEAYNGYEGKPRMVESATYRVVKKGDSTNEKLGFGDMHSFDNKGRIVKNITYNADSVSNGWWHHVYDRKGNIVQNIIYRADSSVSVTNNYQFNKYGQLVKREYVSGKNITVTKRAYDRKKKEVVISGFKSDGSFAEKSIIRFDDQWREIEIKSFLQNGLLKSRIEKSYDKNGNNILSNWYNTNNELYEFYKNSFDEKNHRTGIEAYRVKGGDTTLIKETNMLYHYDAKGNIIYEALSSDGNISWITRTRFTY